MSVHPAATCDLDPLALRADGCKGLPGTQTTRLTEAGPGTRTDPQVGRGPILGPRGVHLRGCASALLVTPDVGACCGTGTACASGSSEPSPALTSMGLSPGQVAAAVRFSFGQTTSETDVAAAVTRLEQVLERLAAHARESCRQTVD